MRPPETPAPAIHAALDVVEVAWIPTDLCHSLKDRLRVDRSRHPQMSLGDLQTLRLPEVILPFEVKRLVCGG